MGVVERPLRISLRVLGAFSYDRYHVIVILHKIRRSRSTAPLMKPTLGAYLGTGDLLTDKFTAILTARFWKVKRGAGDSREGNMDTQEDIESLRQCLVFVKYGYDH
ncbi:hypothetical protein BU25DRAFT_68251 [Macroventuria anomochaeta]|uniref:Uncharacterized protein n=1 Tax=Macroventuria anomochaeta TaxID=301207 RepID=A0ACB6RZ49_9PLEO|nr:uncharacterized protein BU25DRAFT_68251 [Macroventuria anomochaeta]KAF2627048.1 hypothetical protein BU25DRAFT_68251 [Macroventuria anomochaeta]